MKRIKWIVISTFVWMFLSGGMASAADLDTILMYHTFDDARYPEGWTRELQTNWGSNAGNVAGGTAPELVFGYLSQEGFNVPLEGETKLMMPFIPTKGYGNLNFSMLYSFLASSPETDKGYALAVRTTADAEWTEIWSVNDAKPMESGKSMTVKLPENFQNQDSVQLALVIKSKTASKTNFMFLFDNVFFANIQKTQAQLTLPETSWITSDYVFPISGKITNMGLPINEFEIAYKVDDSKVKTTRFTNILSTGESVNFTCRPDWETLEGDHLVKVWVSKINGEIPGKLTDTARKFISVTREVFKYKPLFEEFSNAHCEPCAYYNREAVNPFLEKNGHRFSMIKYQVNTPAKDKYAIEAGLERADYYQIPGAPSMFCNGEFVQPPLTEEGLLATLVSASLKDAFFEISVDTAFVTGKNLTLDYRILPKVTAENLTVYVAVVENTVSGNRGSNGEKEFHHVLMYLHPDADGETVNFKTNQVEERKLHLDLSNTNVEEFSDLRVIIFIQDLKTGMVYQSFDKEIYSPAGNEKENTMLPTCRLYPNPAQDYLTVETQELPDRIEVLDLRGQVVQSVCPSQLNETVSVAGLADGVYVIRLVWGTTSQWMKFVKM